MSRWPQYIVYNLFDNGARVERISPWNEEDPHQPFATFRVLEDGRLLQLTEQEVLPYQEDERADSE